MGAKLGAIRRGLRRSRVDTGGIGSLLLSHVWTAVNAHGHCLAIYGSEGWGFKSSRARKRNPVTRGFSVGTRQSFASTRTGRSCAPRLVEWSGTPRPAPVGVEEVVRSAPITAPMPIKHGLLPMASRTPATTAGTPRTTKSIWSVPRGNATSPGSKSESAQGKVRGCRCTLIHLSSVNSSRAAPPPNRP
jgi:hypothetical protein